LQTNRFKSECVAFTNLKVTKRSSGQNAVVFAEALEFATKGPTLDQDIIICNRRSIRGLVMQEKQQNTTADAVDENQQPETTALISEATPEERIAELEAELAAAQDQFLRSKAEMENLRRRHQEEIGNAHKYAINKFALELLSVKDCLEMALADQSGQFDTLKLGVDLTLKQLGSAFEKAQILEINPLGEPLDPHRHQAIQSEESAVEPNTVLRVMQKGYVVADRLLRPAMVVVSKASA
jgi:molecular chaperone GrpE